MASSSSPNRNTLNQRASRERRRTYIQDLERRVHAYEAQGIHATAEVQAAARKVAEENRSLRTEVEVLREKCQALELKILNFAGNGAGGVNDVAHGVGNGVGECAAAMDKGLRRPGRPKGRRRVGKSTLNEIAMAQENTAGLHFEEHVDEHMHSPDARSISPPATDDLITLAPIIELSHPPLHESDSDANTPPWSSESSPHDDALRAAEEPQIYHPLHQDRRPPYSASQYPSPPLSSSAPVCSPSIATPNSTPCLRAALIIAGMRGVPEHDEATLETEILPELGCVGPVNGPRCLPSERGCSSHAYGAGGVRLRVALAETADCAVDNGRLFGILAREN